MATQSTQDRSLTPVDPRTAIGAVSLTVSDLSRSREFYERAVGLTARDLEDGGVGLGPSGAREIVRLYGDPSAPQLDRRATGLYHLAILLPDRRDLASALGRLAQTRWPLDGASDHLVSEALYLSDPDGNGIEIYRDRPRSEWRYEGGALQMATLPLDLDDVFNELGSEPQIADRVPAGTTIGHVHLQVSELDRIEWFYRELVGLDVTVRLYRNALFMSAGGYHHHLGLNTWQSAGGSPPPPGSMGLRDYELLLPEAADLERIVQRASAAGLPVQSAGDSPLLRDPSGNAVKLVASN
ncbi:MAG: VOC family protein [Solirubrobacteraceae bacterium]